MSSVDLAGYNFAEASARLVIREALTALDEKRRFALLLHGPAACGKSRLAECILVNEFPDTRIFSYPAEKEMGWAIATGLRHRHLWIESGARRPWQRNWLNSETLNAFVMSDEWSYRKFGTQITITALNNIVTILTVSSDVIPDDVCQRFNVVRMLARV